MKKITAGLAVTCLTLGSGISPAAGVVNLAQRLDDTIGAAGIGDPYFPDYGNGGYDVAHYDINVRYGVRSERLRGKTTIKATATQDLSRFNLDLMLRADKVWVDGAAAKYTQSHKELVITPSQQIATGAPFTVKVKYAGVPGKLPDNDLGGWFETEDGAIAAGEPEVAAKWFPSNDHPLDKALFDITVTTDKGTQVISNGDLIKVKKRSRTTSWHWRVKEPMTTYLATAVIGDYKIVKGTTPGGVPYLYGISKHLGRAKKPAIASLRQTPKVVDFFTTQFGDYPFSSTGGTLVNAAFPFSLENQTRPNYSKVFFSGARNDEVIAHELAHMWWGDSVSVKHWQDIWLNEGFATWSSVLYLVHAHGGTLEGQFESMYDQAKKDTGFWSVTIGDPGRRKVFDQSVYYRGAMALQALRTLIGTETHTALLKKWAAERKYGNATIADFQAMAEQLSGKDLDAFFEAWLYSPARPAPSAELGFPTSML